MAKCTAYDFKAIESYWQKYWLEHKTFCVKEDKSKPKYYVLDMFPYPSGAGLHIGHPEGYTASDILGRYKKAKGFNVLHPMGWDAFGLPAEQHAIATGLHPSINTEKNIATFRQQIQHLGFAIDWSREINTTQPEYYRWTQWIFLQLFKHGLAYVDEKPVWWCPQLGTVLANEEVIDGKSERGSFPVERRNLRQWVLRITRYADKLLDGLKDLNWPEATKMQQRAWIGRSEGASISFQLEGDDRALEVFTTRPDTLYGVSFIVLAPENPLVDSIVAEERRPELALYKASVKSKSDLERTDLAKEKSGVFTGRYAIHPMTKERIPVWVADYVLMDYGTGAVMGVPAHDERDFEFAQLYHLPIKPVLQSEEASDTLPYCSRGRLINSEAFNGLTSEEAKQAIVDVLEGAGQAHKTVQYKLHDWLFSRQRYWGEPFPIVWIKESDYKRVMECEGCVFREFLPEHPVTYKEGDETFCALPLASQHLPLRLPSVSSFKPSEESPMPLVNAGPAWLEVKLNLHTGAIEPNDGHLTEAWISGRRETNTMPQWAGSCWYYLRYLSPHESESPVNAQAFDYWKTPDLYIGGAEHAVLHLLYARFWHRFLFDIGVLQTSEPFPHLFHPGIILGTDGNKMSKSRGNVVNPDDIIETYGADTLRMYEMFLGPLEASKPWSTKNIEGIHRFLRKVWREFIDEEGAVSTKACGEKNSPEMEAMLHETIAKVGDDIEHLRFNTAISQLMIFMNRVQKEFAIAKSTAKAFVQMLAPFAPHIAEELWSRMGGQGSVSEASWPEVDASKLVKTQLKIVLQINGKLRDEITVDANDSKELILKKAKESPKASALLRDKVIKREIYVPGKLVNWVV